MEFLNSDLVSTIFDGNICRTDFESRQIILDFILAKLNIKTVPDEVLKELKSSISKFTYLFRKKYKALSYNKDKMLDHPWTHLKFVLPRSFLEYKEKESVQQTPPLPQAHTKPPCITRLELAQLMHDSSCPMSDHKKLLTTLHSYITNKLGLSLLSDDVEKLQNSVHFFILEVNKRLSEKGIRNNYQRFLAKYSKGNMFLAKEFNLPFAIEDYASENSAGNVFDFDCSLDSVSHQLPDDEDQIPCSSMPKAIKDKLGPAKVGSKLGMGNPAHSKIIKTSLYLEGELDECTPLAVHTSMEKSDNTVPRKVGVNLGMGKPDRNKIFKPSI